MSDASDDESESVLKGTTLNVYRLLLKTGKPIGIRKVQKALNLSSPSVAAHHLEKLEFANLVKRANGNYVVSKILLKNTVRISRFLIPRYMFYFVFALSGLILELTILKPETLNREYVFSAVITAIIAFFLCYETIRAWLNNYL
jgi:hypothetical protein